MEPCNLVLDPQLLAPSSLSRFSSSELLTPFQSPGRATPNPFAGCINSLSEALSPLAEEHASEEATYDINQAKDGGELPLYSPSAVATSLKTEGTGSDIELDDPESLVFGTAALAPSFSPRPEGADAEGPEMESPRSSSSLQHHEQDHGSSPQPSVQSTHPSHDSSPFDPSDVGSEYAGFNVECMEGIPSEEVKRELKRARNRDAARQSRAKKKRMVQGIKGNLEELEVKNSELQKENEALKSTNSALEKQLTFFQGLFRKTFDKTAPSLPRTNPSAIEPSDEPSTDGTIASTMATEIRSAVSKAEGLAHTGNSSVAMAMVFFLAFSAAQLDDPIAGGSEMSLQDFQPSGGYTGRTLLSVETFEDEKEIFSMFSTSQVMLRQIISLKLLVWASAFGLLVKITYDCCASLLRQAQSKSIIPKYHHLD